MFPFYGQTGDNFTGATLGGLEYSSSHYLVAGSSIIQDGQHSADIYNIFVTATSRSNFSESSTALRWITDYPQDGDTSASTPQMVKMGPDLFLLLWEVGDHYGISGGQISYVFLDGTGAPVSAVYTGDGYLSDCAPTLQGGEAVWYVTDGFGTTFYTVSTDGTLSAQLTDYAGEEPVGGVFGANDALRWTVEPDGTLVISGKGAMPDDESPWLEDYKNRIPRVVIQSGVTAIGDNAFYNCEGLTSVTIPDSVTSIGDSAFYDCTGLTSVTIPDSVTSIEESAFCGCTGLTSVTIPDSVDRIESWVFGYCTGLTSVTIPDSVTGIAESAFEKCSSLTEVTVPASVRTIASRAFSGCDSLKSVTIKNPDCWIMNYYVKGSVRYYALGDPKKVTVIGLAGSTAEETAKEDGYTFRVLGLDAPQIKKAENTASGVKITWGKVDGAAKYRVYYKGGSVKSWTKLKDVTGDSYTWTKAKSGTKYSFTVKALDASGKAGSYDTTGKSLTYIAAPKISKATRSGSTVKLTWGKVTGAAKYRVYYRAGGGKWTKLIDTTKTSYTWTKAKSSTIYSFTVRCISSNGKSFTSGYDTTGKALAVTKSPTVKASNVSGGIQVSWSKVTGAEKYRVFYKTSANGKWVKIGDTAKTSYTRAAKYLTAGKTYWFTVRCVTADGKAYTSGYNAKGVSVAYKK